MIETATRRDLNKTVQPHRCLNEIVGTRLHFSPLGLVQLAEYIITNHPVPHNLKFYSHETTRKLLEIINHPNYYTEPDLLRYWRIFNKFDERIY